METRSTEAIEDSTERLLHDLKAVVKDGEELLQARARDISEQGMAARERLAAALEVARTTRDRLEARVRGAAQSADSHIREHPYQSVGIAFGIGMLIGILVNRK